MEMSDAARRLCWHGLLLFFLGLVTGGLVPLFTNPRMGLSAHLAGVQNGMALLLFGLVWSRLSLSETSARLAHWMALGSMYAIWLSLLLAAILGTSGSTPIAGAGFAGAPWQELSVTALLYAGSLAILVATLILLVGLRRPGPNRES